MISLLTEPQMSRHGKDELDMPTAPAPTAIPPLAPTKLGRTTYIVGSVTFIFIGVLHTLTHLTELSTPELKARFAAFGEIDVSGQTVAAWDLWQGTSLLMGLFALTLGLSNLGALRSSKDRRPPVINCVATIAVLAAVGLIGWAYLGPLQMVGGPIGIGLFTTALVSGRLRNA